MMMGSLEESIAQINTPQEPNDVVNDLDLPDEELTVDNSIYISKIEKRIATYKIDILNPPRDNKYLIVLDIDYTIFDHRSTAEQPVELMRPYLHEFLTTLYPYYDIMFWSATSMKWILEKLKLLGVTNHPDYKIVCHLDSAAMISVSSSSPKHELVDVKPLQVIWGKFPQYSPTNTVMLDDIRHNFLMNKQSGLRIRAFRQAHFNRYKDKELFFLAKYLKYIAKKHIDLTTLNHRKWESFISHAKDLDQILYGEEDLTANTTSQNENSNNTTAED
ncbi:ubiquitin-like domain-containing CTD phosphatase 1 isoform X2 [Chrysoperla carnea]|nr:ubiquitin-like domain-containing CTD phosphatase 1 isoform X2 [Chrysoperla carnea]